MGSIRDSYARNPIHLRRNRAVTPLFEIARALVFPGTPVPAVIRPMPPAPAAGTPTESNMPIDFMLIICAAATVILCLVCAEV
jgi:hypothetical protein